MRAFSSNDVTSRYFKEFNQYLDKQQHFIWRNDSSSQPRLKKERWEINGMLMKKREVQKISIVIYRTVHFV
ncbi:hypothetical protein DXT76_19055 [Halobacillus trueperi]|uniref:Uncharacterized protein n=1 Tax=Halobacillus trueperi TaxID=156205 RepID=A0A3D8VEZ9_9BACI|nr:hypothetical protein DXT76_19055 [Halobacillus trueperi]